MNVDIISDLHIDSWNNNYKSKYITTTKHMPFNFEDWQHQNINTTNEDQSTDRSLNILIIAGDISDDMITSMKYLNDMHLSYDKVLLIDGNHEHAYKFPSLYSNEELIKIVDEYASEELKKKLVFLPEKDFIANDTVFIGINSWWDYRKEDKDVVEYKQKNYFVRWMAHLTFDDSCNFIVNVVNKAKKHATILRDKIKKYTNHPKIKNIVITTHSVPLGSFCLDKYRDTEMNTFLEDIILDDSVMDHENKKYYWIFGHTHSLHKDIRHNISFLANPRGRPTDMNRETYKPERIVIE